MTEPPFPDFIIVGPQKCATTWVYKCLYEHPEVLMPETDSVHYFDINYHLNNRWYRNHFLEYNGEPVVGEETPTYIRDEMAPKRIAETIPDVKLIFTLRNPIDRAYSHWWHEKSKNKHSFEFREVLENYDLFQNWIAPGFYYRHLSRYTEHIPEENIKVCLFDDLADDDLAYIQDVYSFIGVDDDYVPSLIDQKVNQGKFRAINRQTAYMTAVESIERLAPETVINSFRPVHKNIMQLLAAQTEYEQGMDQDVRRDLERIFIDDINKLSSHIGRELDNWLEYEEL